MKISDWYWQYGVKRNAPKYAMSLDKWLDPVSRLEARREAILASKDQKACVALWGMSQTGKSTLLSRYLDGKKDDGSDSALTWNPKTMKVRFLATNSAQQDAAQVVFNPFNGGRDASGVATRYTLRSDGDESIDRDFPIEMKLMSRKQFMHALARGYLSECSTSKKIVVSGDVEKMLQQAKGGDVADRRSFELMQDALDIVELMRVGTTRFEHLFQNDNWSAIRNMCLVSHVAVGPIAGCEAFVSQLLWDGEENISSLYNKAIGLLESLKQKWSGCRILMTAEVAALFLNIDSYGNFCITGKGDVGNLTWRKSGDDNIVFEVGGSGVAFKGEDFGVLQALCRELIVPLRRKALETGNGRPLLELLEMSDILDLPGLSRKGTGEALKSAANLNDVDLLKDVLKEGRTQSYVYNYAIDYSVDAFLVLVRSNEYVQKAETINDGIKNWFRSFDQNWDVQAPPPLPVFIDITFFGEHLNNVPTMTPGGSPWSMVADWVQDKLAISNSDTARYFLTNYPNLPDGDISRLPTATLARMQGSLIHDADFLTRLNLTSDDITSVFHDGGVDRMLGIVAKSIDGNKRKAMCDVVFQKIRSDLVRMIDDHLPKPAQQLLQQRTALINRRNDHLNNDLDAIRNGVPGMTCGNLAKELKKLFEVKPEWFDPVPINFGNMQKPLQQEFILRQVDNWYMRKTADVRSSVGDVNELDEDMAILEALRGIFYDPNNRTALNELASCFVGWASVFGGIRSPNDGWASRLSLALAFSNILRTGTARTASQPAKTTLADMIDADQTGDTDENKSPHYLLQVKPLQNRILSVSQNAVATTRQPQAGDAELAAIKVEI